MIDNNGKSGNSGIYSEFQDGHQVLNNTILNHIYNNASLKPNEQLSTYPKSQNAAENNVISAGFNESYIEFRVNQEL